MLRRSSQSSLLLLLPCLLLMVCSSSTPPLDANTTTLTISANPTSIKNYGQISTITLRATNSDGTPAWDGTKITLSTDGGFIEEEVILDDGKAVASYISSDDTGTFTVSASSGTVGVNGDISVQVEVVDGREPIDNLGFFASPNNLTRLGGPVEIWAIASDQYLNAMPGQNVIFSTDYGRLESNGQARLTDETGTAYDMLYLTDIPSNVTSINLTATTRDLSQATTITISDNETPTASFVYSPADIEKGQSVNFDASASNDSDGEVLRYFWHFGDSPFPTEGAQVIAHIFNKANTFTVRLTVVDEFGASDTTTQDVTVGDNESPVAAFTFSPADIRTGEVVSFDAVSSTDSDGEIVTYEWDMGDNSRLKFGERISHSYQGADTYTVTLKVYDDEGATAVTTNDVTVTGNTLPTAKLSYTPENPKPFSRTADGDMVGLDASESSDDDGSIVKYTWRFKGPSTTDDPDIDCDNLFVETSGPLLNHCFYDAGTWQVFLTVQDDDGGLGFATVQIDVAENQAPNAVISASPSEPKEGEQVLFDATGSSDPDGTIASVNWTFGDDGSTAVGFYATHTFSAGTSIVTLTVTDDDNASSMVTLPLTVQTNDAPSANLTLNAQTTQERIFASGAETTDDHDALRDLGYSFATSQPSGVTLTGVPLDEPYESVFTVEYSDLCFVFDAYIMMTVSDSDENSTSTTGKVEYSPRDLDTCSVATEAPGDGGNGIGGNGFKHLAARLWVGPRVANERGYEWPLIGEFDGTGSDVTHLFLGYTNGKGSLSIHGSGSRRTARLVGGAPGDQVTFDYQVLTADGQHSHQQHSLTLDPYENNSAPRPRLEALWSRLDEQGAELLLDGRKSLDLEQPRGLRYKFRAYVLKAGAKSTLVPIQARPGTANLRLDHVTAGDILRLDLVVTDPRGASAHTSHYLIVPPHR